MVCCDRDQLLNNRLQGVQQNRPGAFREPTEIFLGKMVPLMHDVSGEVYAVGPNQLLINRFTYDGRGPEAFFLAGTSGSKPSKDGFPVPYPYSGVNYKYGDKSVPKLREFKGEEVLLTLPSGMDVSQLKWLGVWCRRFEVSFGHILL